MKIYPNDYVIQAEKPAPAGNDPAAVAKARARIKVEMGKDKPCHEDHLVSVLSAEGLLSGLVDVYAVIRDGGADWKVEVVEAVEEPEVIEGGGGK